MLFLTDECMHAAIVAGLRAIGHDVHHIRETNQGASDEVVLSLAAAEQRLLVTEDKDYGDLVIRRGLPVPGLILLRLSTVDPDRKVQRLREALASHADRLVGHHLVIEDSTVRIRPLLHAL